MASSTNELVLPRPWDEVSKPLKKGLSAPREEEFTKNFGVLLPPVKYLKMGDAKVAYYEMLPPTSVVAETSPSTPDRVLVIHSVRTPSLGMLPFVRALKPSFPQAHFVLLDLYGHGLSDTPILAHQPELFFELIDALLDTLRWPTAHFVGFSFGGALSAGYAASRPSRVNSMSLIAPAGLLNSSNFTPEQQGYLRGGDETGARKWIFQFLEGDELIVPADWKEKVANNQIVAEAIAEWQTREHVGHTASVVAIFRDGGVRDKHDTFMKAAQTGIPAIFILGEHDGICSEQDAHNVGFSNVVVIPATGHLVVREKAMESAAAVKDFWQGLDKLRDT